MDNSDIFGRPDRKVVTKSFPRPKITRKKPPENQWITQDAVGMSSQERTDPRDERQLVLAAVGRDLNLYRFASDELRSDRAWVRSVVKKDWRALEHTSQELKNDREIVLLAVKQDGHAMSFASRELRNDKEIVLAVMLAHDTDAFVQAASCRAIARLATNQPHLQSWFGAQNGCEAVVSALLQHSDDKSVQLQGCRAIAALCTTFGTVDKVQCAHRGNQDGTATSGGCAAIVDALVNFHDSPDVTSAAVQAGRALVANHQLNEHSIQSLAFEASTSGAAHLTKADKARNLSVATAMSEILTNDKLTLTPSKFQLKLKTKRPVFDACQVTSRPTTDSSVLDQVRGDGGTLAGNRDVLLKKVDSSMGVVVGYGEMHARAQETKFEKRKDRPPFGKPEGLEDVSVSFFVTSS
mmetsp:Transcript_40464/g.52094  ORF Transcript_40464/g.52094 Transcript_40464/m.52094 type:complete len:409 (+) Transcript_40464:39-1265(+)